MLVSTCLQNIVLKSSFQKSLSITKGTGPQKPIISVNRQSWAVTVVNKALIDRHGGREKRVGTSFNYHGGAMVIGLY